MSKKQKKQMFKVIVFVVLAFIALVIFIPLLPVTAVEVGVEATAWQNIHQWFLDIKNFFVETWGLLLLMLGILFGGHLFINKK